MLNMNQLQVTLRIPQYLRHERILLSLHTQGWGSPAGFLLLTTIQPADFRRLDSKGRMQVAESKQPLSWVNIELTG